MKLLLGRTIFFGMVVFVGSTAFANFHGVWKGDAILTTRQGQQMYCDEIILNVTQSEDKMEFGNFRYACDEFAFNFTPPVLFLGEKNILSQDVTWDGKHVGKITATKADLLFPLAKETDKARYTVRKKSEHQMDYIDEQIGVNAQTGNQEITKIHANLTRVQ